ncbi:MAG: branched-chain amino acid ABC transporter permease, partial [Actinobacteria bacterium]|nr:branched-chain amino acid ABC transporter permease [Actinomycetota bacterium]
MLEQLPQNIISGLLTGGLYALVGIGLALIFGVMRVVNFAHGELLMIGMYVTYFLFEKAGIDPYISLLIGMPLLFILGAVIQRVLIDPVLEAPEMNQILLTVGLGLVFTNTVQLLFTADYRQIRTSYSETTLRPLGLFVNVPYLISFLVALTLAIALYWFLMKTDFGRSLR